MMGDMHDMGVGMCGNGHVWQRHAWQGACLGVCMAGGHAWQGGMCGGGCAWQGACVATEMATAADGMHPTGMHYC